MTTTTIFSTKNPKSTSSFRNYNLLSVIRGTYKIGHIVRFYRQSQNRFGGTNDWEVVQFIPCEGYEHYDLLSIEGQDYKDLLLYGRNPEQMLHLGAYNGNEEKIFFADMKKFYPIEIQLEECPLQEWREVIGKVNLHWGGERYPITNENLFISDDEVVLKLDGYVCRVREFEFDYFKVAEEIQISQLVEHFDKLFSEEEAPSEDEINKLKRSTLA